MWQMFGRFTGAAGGIYTTDSGIRICLHVYPQSLTDVHRTMARYTNVDI